jgi:drug/metabolite transporter (DMT)-like permease
MAVIVRSFALILIFFVHASVLYYSSEAKINFSLVVNLYSLTPFLTAVAFYCFFKELIKTSHLIGMFFIVLCVYITAESSAAQINQA